jgi:CheY-like chemotaxis protein
VLETQLPQVTVLSCDSGEAACRELDTHSVDFVTTALRLPAMDGLEFARRVREHPAQAYIPIVLVSGDVQERLIARAIGDDVTDYFDKSLGFEALAEFIRGYVSPAEGAQGTVLYVEDSQVVALAALLVIGNTVRLDIQGRREEIVVMQLLGASNGFVRRPLLYTGFWYGLGGGVVAVATVAAIGLALDGPLQRLLASYDEPVGLHGFGLHAGLALAVVGSSALLGWLGAWLVASGHLEGGSPDA